ncbi:MAG: sigma-70 family RNA polymerase sigma factor [Deltaproteobacteria bacterium]|nr:sigma-70 family RNA polymerase sigma factor [Deltaproteobacteria bacterium]MBW2116781.1 sigma-70 family RNA polymerase sigma factor [Deltaproteobacteria bacterium]MBW2345232.1 sigma-70 family RNA polymerase sigma factor [Deltaproteobacteria bacterium]
MNQTATNAIDHDLIARFKAGSMEAMEKIMERYEKQIFTFGLKMCGHLQDAEDIVQETFLNAFRYLGRFREETKLKNWLFRIAARACIRKRRKKKCEPDQQISLESFVHEDGSDIKYEIPDWSDDPSDNFLRAELKQVIDASIQSLPHKYRLVFNLRDTEGFNTVETSEILGISIQAVKTRLHRARLFLREEISKHYREGKVQ